VRNLRIPIVIAVFVAVLAGGLGLRHIYLEKRVIDPLIQATGALPGVAWTKIVDRGDGSKELWMALQKGAELDEAYPEVEALARASLGSSLRGVVVVDNPNPRLQEVYHRIHYTVHEALLTGRFAWMADEIEQALRSEEGITHRVVVGDRHLFVQLQEGDAELLRVLPRTTSLLALEDGGARGDVRW